MRLWPYSAPKTPGFGLSDRFYLTVFMAQGALPSISEIVSPRSETGAVDGFGVPLKAGSEKADLERPLYRGAWAISSRDRKTVLKMLVMSPDELGYPAQSYADRLGRMGVRSEIVETVRAAWNIAQFTFASHDPMVYPALDFEQTVVRRLATLADGAVVDPISERFLLPPEVAISPRQNPLIDARDHVSIRFRSTPAGETGYTLGMQKFALPEFEVHHLGPEHRDLASMFLLGCAQRVLLTGPVAPGATLTGFRVAEGGFDRALWEGIPVYELLPPTSVSTGEALISALAG